MIYNFENKNMKTITRQHRIKLNILYKKVAIDWKHDISEE